MASKSLDGLASASAAIDQQVITDEVLGVRQGHRKGVGHIINGKRKVADTSYFAIASRSEQSQVAKDHRRLAERVDTQQCDLKAQHREINAFKVFITQALD